jgi:hypothetical protein
MSRLCTCRRILPFTIGAPSMYVELDNTLCSGAFVSSMSRHASKSPTSWPKDFRPTLSKSLGPVFASLPATSPLEGVCVFVLNHRSPYVSCVTSQTHVRPIAHDLSTRSHDHCNCETAPSCACTGIYTPEISMQSVLNPISVFTQ